MREVKVFFCYVYGRKFRKHTDHKLLKRINKTKYPISMVVRFYFKLSEYNNEVKHKSSKLNINSDVLSRISKENIEIEDIKPCMKEKPLNNCRIFPNLELTCHKYYNNYFTSCGVLMRQQTKVIQTNE